MKMQNATSLFAPQGQPQTSPGQRPGDKVSTCDQALKGRNTSRTKPMSQSLVKNLVHLVYCTKNRKDWIPKDHRTDLFAYQAGIFQKWESPALMIGGVGDHVHALFSLSKNSALKKIVEEVKKGSFKWMKLRRPSLSDFGWQAGYSAFSVSQSNNV